MYSIVLVATNTAEMSDDLKGVIITAIVTSIISIIGFIVTNISMRKNFKNELLKQRDSIALEKMATMPYEVLVLMDEMIESNKTKNRNQQDKSIEHFKDIMNTIYSYGSEEAIRIAALMQKENYAANGVPNKLDQFRLISAYVLLTTQIKHDVTEVTVSPKFWFQMKMTDYEKNKDQFKMANNKLVDELDLSNDFKIK